MRHNKIHIIQYSIWKYFYIYFQSHCHSIFIFIFILSQCYNMLHFHLNAKSGWLPYFFFHSLSCHHLLPYLPAPFSDWAHLKISIFHGNSTTFNVVLKWYIQSKHSILAALCLFYSFSLLHCKPNYSMNHIMAGIQCREMVCSSGVCMYDTTTKWRWTGNIVRCLKRIRRIHST